MSAITTERQKNLDKLVADFEQSNAVQQKACQYARKAASHLKTLTPGDPSKPLDFDTIKASHGLSTILNEFVHRDWSHGGHLCIEWAIEQFWGLQLQEQFNMLTELHETLMVKGHRNRRKAFVYNDYDYSAWIEHIRGDTNKNTRSAFVLDSQSRSILYVIDNVTISDECQNTAVHVRHVANRTKHIPGLNKRYIELPSLVWYRNRDFEMKYNDCRDDGYILTYRNRPGELKVDRAYDHMSEIAHVLWFAQITLDELKSE